MECAGKRAPHHVAWKRITVVNRVVILHKNIRVHTGQKALKMEESRKRPITYKLLATWQ